MMEQGRKEEKRMREGNRKKREEWRKNESKEEKEETEEMNGEQGVTDCLWLTVQSNGRSLLLWGIFPLRSA